MQSEYYILTLDPRLGEVFSWIERNQLVYHVHLNRTRFWVPHGALHTEFILRFSECCPPVDPSADLITGLGSNQ